MQPLLDGQDNPEQDPLDVRDILANRLIGDGAVSELAHVVLGGMVALLSWRWAPHYDVVFWVAAVAMGALGRAVFRSAGARRGPAAIIQATRRGVLAVALAWGTGLLLVGPVLPLESLAWITMVFAGIVSGGLITLLADAVSFHLLEAGLLIPLMITIGLNGNSTNHLAGITLVAMYGVAMGVYYHRTRDVLLEQVRTGLRLVRSERRTEQALVAAERLNRVIESTTDYVGIADPHGRFRYLNRAGREMIGVGPDEDISGLSIIDLAPARLRDDIRTVRIPQVMKEGSLQGETIFVHRDGHEIPVSLSAIVHRAPDGSVEGLSAIARDVSQEVATRGALDRARAAAEQAAAARSAFLANTSHEIRTPLNGILGLVELLLDTDLTPSQRRSIELIATSGETLLNTLNDVLDLSKIEAGQLEIEHLAFDLHQLVHSTARLFASRASAAGLELVSDVGTGVPQHVVGDAHRLRQVLSNLLGNAIKFTTQGEIVLTTRARPGEDGVMQIDLSVRDTGIGIAPEHIQRIFEPFRQVDASTTRHYGGTGLGLSISRRLVDLMGGRLSVESQPGRGSEFRFTLPLRVTSEPDAGVPGDAGDLDGLRVLVVDDHPVNRRILADMLRWGGCVADDVGSAAIALDALRGAQRSGEPFGLVVSDVQMPGQDGFDLVTAMREDPALRDVPVMLLSSATRRGDNERCRTLRVSVFLQKPVSRLELIEAASAALREPGGRPEARISLVTRHTIEEARRTCRVLLAEDNPVNQEVASTMLRRRGHDVTTVDNGAEVVDAVRTGSYDVVLMDIQMPVMDGLEATREIRRTHPNAPAIIALTANVSQEERQRCLDAGMNGYLPKPFRPHALFAAVEGWSGDKRETPTSTATQPDSAPVNLAEFRQALADGGIESIGDEMLRLFVLDANGRMAELRRRADAGDIHAIGGAAHAYKSSAANIRASRLTQLLQRAEDAAHAGEVDGSRALVSEIEREHERVMDFLRSSGVRSP